MSEFHEVVYVNHGLVYKAQTPYSLGQHYVCDFDADPIFNFVKNDGKRYWVTEEFKSHFRESDVAPAVLDGYPLCPAVTLWLAVGVAEQWDQQNFDLYFAIDSSAQLAEIATFYELPDPSTAVLRTQIDEAPETIAMYNASGRHIVVGAVKYVDGTPTFLKLYTYPKAHEDWSVWMHGKAYENGGELYEEGVYFTRMCGGITEEGKDYNGTASDMDETYKVGLRSDGTKIEYRFNDSGSEDPFIGWAGFESDGRKREFETCAHVREWMAGYLKGEHFENQHDLTEAAALWFARSHYGTPDEWAEVYFAATSSAQVKQVADYYGLPTPLSAELAAELDTGNGRYRVRHYEFGDDLVCINAGSVIFENGVPTKILFYTFLRPWEFEEYIPLPDNLI